MEAQKGCCSDNSGCCFSGCMSNGMVVWLTQYFQWLILFQRLLLRNFWGRFLSSIGCCPKDSSGWLNVSIGFNFSSSSFIVSSGSVVSLFANNSRFTFWLFVIDLGPPPGFEFPSAAMVLSQLAAVIAIPVYILAYFTMSTIEWTFEIKLYKNYQTH